MRIEIPAIGLKAKASGGIVPTPSDLCKGGDKVCYDPPVDTQVAWGKYCGLPSYPSNTMVCLFGHSNAFHPAKSVFNNLPALRAGDTITIWTETGVFVYRLRANPQQVNFSKLAQSKWVWNMAPDRLVLITCEIAPSGGSYSGNAVVEAFLVSAKPLG